MAPTILTGLVLGTVLGYVMQRGRFCVTGMIRDIFLQKTFRGITALFIVIAVHAIGLAALTSAGIISPELENFAPLATVVGGLMFGVGIILAGGCASGTWYRSGEGLVGSWIALFLYGTIAAAMNAGALNGFNTWMKSHTVEATTIHSTLGISVWWLAVPFAAATAVLAGRFLRQEAAAPKIATLAPKKSGLAHLLAEKQWHFYSTAVIIGLLGVIAWPLSAATGRNFGLGITGPSSDTIRYLTTGDTSRINWGVMLVFGILIGSFIAARVSGEFRVRVPSAQQAVRSVGGGTLMGVGAVLAGGCTVGNGMVETSLFTWQGWIGLLAIAGGIWAASKVFLKPTDPVNPLDGDVKADARPASVSLDAGFIAPSANVIGAGAATGGVATLEAPAAKQLQGLVSLGNGHYKLDSLGAVCPFPLIDAKDAMQYLDSGETLVIDFDCTQATDAIPRWAATDGHEVTNFEATGDAGWTISVKKA